MRFFACFMIVESRLCHECAVSGCLQRWFPMAPLRPCMQSWCWGRDEAWAPGFPGSSPQLPTVPHSTPQLPTAPHSTVWSRASGGSHPPFPRRLWEEGPGMNLHFQWKTSGGCFMMMALYVGSGSAALDFLVKAPIAWEMKYVWHLCSRLWEI